MKTIKSIIYKRFSVDMVELTNGDYRINYRIGDEDFITKPVKDVNSALSTFDSTLCMIQGH